MIIGEGVITLKDESDFCNLCVELNVSSNSTIDDVADILWFDRGVVLIDKRSGSEMLQAPAQSSPEFFSEEMTFTDMEELNERRRIYEVVKDISSDIKT